MYRTHGLLSNKGNISKTNDILFVISQIVINFFQNNKCAPTRTMCTSPLTDQFPKQIHSIKRCGLVLLVLVVVVSQR